MGWVQEIAEVFKKFTFIEAVYEYEHGLKFRLGKVVQKRRKLDPKELEDILKEEREAVKKSGKLGYMIPFYRKKLPEGYSDRDFWTGLPLHPKRFQVKTLEPGIYFFIPLIEAVVTDYRQEKVLNLGNISVPTTDDDTKVITLSCNLRYELLNYYKAYTQIHDYELSLKSHTLSVLAKHSRGKTLKQWKDSGFIEELEKSSREELREIATEKWGLKIHDIYITDNVPSNFQRVLYEGMPVADRGIVNPAQSS